MRTMGRLVSLIVCDRSSRKLTVVMVRSGIDRGALILDTIVRAHRQAAQAFGLIVIHGESRLGEGRDLGIGVERIMSSLGGCRGWVRRAREKVGIVDLAERGLGRKMVL